MEERMGLLDNVFGKRDKNDGKNDKNAPRGTPAPAPRADTPRADFSAVQGASSTTAPADVTRVAAPAARTYTVKAGDSLSKIAQRELGDGTKWRAIYEANRDTVKNPDLIHPGQVLNLPSA
jgi:nucleoid-associated protein YgaU